MIKKFLSLMMLLAMITFMSGQVEAADRWFYTGRDGHQGYNGDTYYVRDHVINSHRSVCTVIKIRGSSATTLTYIFYDFDSYGNASYSKRLGNINGQEIDKGDIAGTVSLVVHALYSKIVVPERSSYGY